MNSFLYKADSKELWLVMPKPQNVSNTEIAKWEHDFMLRLHYTCSPELAAILTEGQEVKENEFGLEKYAIEDAPIGFIDVAIPPEQTKPKEVRSFTLQDMISAVFEGEVIGEEMNVTKRKKLREKYFQKKFRIDINKYQP